MRKTILAAALLLYPLSNFFAPKAYAQMQEDPYGTHSGIGVAVQLQNNKFYVLSIDPGSPAFRAGILIGDIISAVNGKATGGMTLAQLTQAVLGPKGAHVQIGVTRQGQPNLLVFDLIRNQVPNSDAGQKPPGAPAAQASDNPADSHDPGVYMMVAAQDGKEKMAPIQQVDPGRVNAGIGSVLGMAFSYGIHKARLTTDIPGPHAPVRTQEKAPVFYMYFPSMDYLQSHGIVTLSPATVFGTAQTVVVPPSILTSPTQFSLILLEEKKDHRETTVGEVGMASSSAGSDEKRAFLFNAERIRSGIYKVAPTQDLKPGEYAFISATRGAGTATGTTVVIYDFGVDAR